MRACSFSELNMLYKRSPGYKVFVRVRMSSSGAVPEQHLHRKRKHAPEPDLINAASHNKAFDRIFLCDYMFRFVDSAFNTLLKNRLKLAEIRKKCAEAPHVQGISGDGEEESEAENSCYSDEEEEEEKIIFKRVLEAACEYTNTGGNTFHEGQREVYYRPGHFSSETPHDAAYAF